MGDVIEQESEEQQSPPLDDFIPEARHLQWYRRHICEGKLAAEIAEEAGWKPKFVQDILDKTARWFVLRLDQNLEAERAKKLFLIDDMISTLHTSFTNSEEPDNKVAGTIKQLIDQWMKVSGAYPQQGTKAGGLAAAADTPTGSGKTLNQQINIVMSGDNKPSTALVEAAKALDKAQEELRLVANTAESDEEAA